MLYGWFGPLYKSYICSSYNYMFTCLCLCTGPQLEPTMFEAVMGMHAGSLGMTAGYSSIGGHRGDALRFWDVFIPKQWFDEVRNEHTYPNRWILFEWILIFCPWNMKREKWIDWMNGLVWGKSECTLKHSCLHMSIWRVFTCALISTSSLVGGEITHSVGHNVEIRMRFWVE